jgi:DNA-binding winged helix-turn-helix (wHTH) protein/alpha-beta hydrolase superfamily lysophospholipase
VPATLPSRWGNEDFALDPTRRELRRGSELIAVEPSVFDLLLYLIVHRDRVVTKDDLTAAVWDGRIVSDSTMASRMNAARQAVGDSGARQRLIRTIARKGHRFVGEIREHTALGMVGSGNRLARQGELQPRPVASFVKTVDNVNLSVAAVGKGPVLLRTAHWYTHVDVEWNNPLTSAFMHRLESNHRFIFYDGRGAGLSDRDVPDMSFESYNLDLEAVGKALKLRKFALLGMSGGAATAIAYAAQNPHKISKLVLYGGYALGRNKRRSPQTTEEAKAFLTMIRSAWNKLDSPFWRAFASFFLPNATAEQFRWFSDLHSRALSLESGIMARTAVDEIDVSAILAQVNVPTLVFHSVRDKQVPFEQGRIIATSIPNAKFVALDSEYHTLLPGEPAWTQFVNEMETFLGAKV